jgi:predicted metal-dependent hydrolase
MPWYKMSLVRIPRDAPVNSCLLKTKWGSCNPRAGHIRLNTELVKKPKDLLEYIIAHEITHCIEPTHNRHFLAILEEHYPTWREARAELNELPLAAEVWND